MLYHHRDDKVSLHEVLNDLDTGFNFLILGIIPEMLEAFYKNEFNRYKVDEL